MFFLIVDVERQTLCYDLMNHLSESMMKRIGCFLKRLWEGYKILYVKSLQEEQVRRTDSYRGPGVNPSTGMPMISGTGVDCAGNSFGTNSWSNRY